MSTAQSAPAQPKSWYTIRQFTPVAAAAKGVQSAAEISIYGDIGETWWSESVSAAQFVRDLKELVAESITIRINSYGGSVSDGIAIHNAIKRHPAKTVTSVDGVAYSIASLIAMAGDEREMAENAMMMLHAPWGGIEGNAVRLRELADHLDGWARAMSTTYANASGMAADDVLALLSDGNDHFYTASEAKACGLVHTVVASVPEAAAAMASFDLRRFGPGGAALRAPAASAHATLPLASPLVLPPAAVAALPLENSMLPTNAPGNQQTELTAQARADLIAQAGADALAADKARRTSITQAFAKFAGAPGVAELQTACLDNAQCTVEAAGQQLLARLGANATSVAGALPGIQIEEGRDQRIDAMATSVLARAGIVGGDGKRIVAQHNNPYRGAKMLDLARASLPESQRNASYDQMSVFAAAFTQSTSDFPILLENIMHKSVQAGYALAKDTWSMWCHRGSVSDFRVHKRYRVGSLSNLEDLDENGEFRNKAIPDGERSSITASTKGNLVNISRQIMVNDDLAAFVGLTNSMGRAAKRTVEAAAWNLVTSNPNLDDGVALYSTAATRLNLAASGAVISTASVEAVRVAMALQKDVGGNDPLNLTPSILLCPTSLGGLAREVNGAEFNDDTSKNQRKPNVVRGIYSTIVDTPYLTGTAWYTLADPNEAPVYEVAFLDGNDMPFTEWVDGFKVDGVMGKVRLDFAVAAIDYRGAYKQPGA